MFSIFGTNPHVLREAQRLADHQRKVISIMTLFPDAQYKSHPTYEQFALFTDDAESQGYTLDGMYSMFASGRMDSTIDALIRKHAQGWRPMGEVVEGTRETPLLPSPE